MVKYPKFWVFVCEEETVKRFRLDFTAVVNDDGELFESRSMTRVILADDLGAAKQIANAMLGEPVTALEFLYGVEVRETDESPSLFAWDEEVVWPRTLEKLGLNNSSVEFLYYDGRKVGIRSQRFCCHGQ